MSQPEKVSVLTLRRMKAEQRKITMITCYDATFARLVDATGIDVVLVGDSVGMVVQGHPNTLPVTVDQMIYHGQAVARGMKRAHVVVDMPFMSYHVSVQQAVETAGRLVKEGMAEAVKLEGGRERLQAIEAITRAQIPVMGHLGLTPQSVHAFGGFKVQGKRDDEARRIVEDARAIEEAGAYSLVLEGIPMELAAEITEQVRIPTIGIGAGVHCDGQVLVLYDLLGMDDSFRPKFVKRYAQLGAQVRQAVDAYVEEVRGGVFPDDDQSFHREAARRVKMRQASR
ncbi:3-methyl-2-oxobutanoate hydroxymethyltransferase [Myxococcota bacterium]|nr:3-methyl-2-oxobutanoate hydroxymethyltransferase [Myxococcota bacterium]